MVKKRLILIFISIILLTLCFLSFYFFNNNNSFVDAYNNGNLEKQIEYAFKENLFNNENFIDNKSFLIDPENNTELVFINSKDYYACITINYVLQNSDINELEMYIYSDKLKINVSPIKSNENFNYWAFTDLKFEPIFQNNNDISNDIYLNKIYNECEITKKYLNSLYDKFEMFSEKKMTSIYNQLKGLL